MGSRVEFPPHETRPGRAATAAARRSRSGPPAVLEPPARRSGAPPPVKPTPLPARPRRAAACCGRYGLFRREKSVLLIIAVFSLEKETERARPRAAAGTASSGR